jgi:hypothetical protein
VAAFGQPPRARRERHRLLADLQGEPAEQGEPRVKMTCGNGIVCPLAPDRFPADRGCRGVPADVHHGYLEAVAVRLYGTVRSLPPGLTVIMHNAGRKRLYLGLSFASIVSGDRLV